MMPLSVGILIAGPVSGYLSDRYGSRPFATGGMVATGIAFVLLELLQINFSYPLFAAIILLNGIGTGAFASPNRAGVMNSLPARDRGAGGGMNQTFQNSAQVLSIGIFFTLMTIGLSAMLPHALATGLEAHGVPAHTAATVSHLPPISVLFAAFLGYSPIARLVPTHVLHHLSNANAAAPTIGRDIAGRYFQGEIDEVSIFHRALNAGEVQLLYSAPTTSAATAVCCRIVSCLSDVTTISGSCVPESAVVAVAVSAIAPL